MRRNETIPKTGVTRFLPLLFLLLLMPAVHAAPDVPFDVCSNIPILLIIMAVFLLAALVSKSPIVNIITGLYILIAGILVIHCVGFWLSIMFIVLGIAFILRGTFE